MRLRNSDTLRVCTWDVENRPLAYWVPDRPTAEITAIAWKWLDEPDPHALLLTRDGRFIDDDGRRIAPKTAYLRFREVLLSAGINCGHNVRSHDLPLFNTGLQRLGLPLLPPLLTTDTLRDSPKAKDMSRSLENLVDLFDLEDDESGGKLHMSVVAWERANRLTEKGLTKAYARVTSDVILQERLRAELIRRRQLAPPRMWFR